MIAPSFVQPEADAKEARVRRDEADVRATVQGLEDGASACARDPEQVLDERPVLKAVRGIDWHLTDIYATDDARAAFRRSFRRAFEAGHAVRASFSLSDGISVVWIDLYPPLPDLRPDDAESGQHAAPRVAHVYLDSSRATSKARQRWARVAPRPGLAARLDVRDIRVEGVDAAGQRAVPRPSKRLAPVEEWERP